MAVAETAKNEKSVFAENGMAATLEVLGQIALYRGRASDLVFGVTGRGGLSDGFSVLG